MEYFDYEMPEGRISITVWIERDCGIVRDSQGKQWHKVIARPIGFNNSIPMVLDKNKLTPA